MKRGSVSIIGNSVALLMDPPRSGPHERTYGEILRSLGYQVGNAAKQAATVADVFRYLDDEVLRHFPDYLVVHFGIVECSARGRPRSLQHWFDENDWCNSLAGTAYQGPRRRAFKRLVRVAYRETVERAVYALRLQQPWIAARTFDATLRQVVARVQKHTPVKQTILVGITPITAALEARMPGTSRNAAAFNAILSRAAESMPDTAFISLDGWQDVTIDGIHLTAGGHARLAEEIAAAIGGVTHVL